MAGPKAAEKGTRGSFKLRAGIDFPAFDGMVRENDGAAIPDEAFQQLENVIFKGINPKDRPGLVKATNLVTGPIEGLYDASDIGAAQLESPPTPLGPVFYLPGIETVLGHNRGVLAFDSVSGTVSATLLGPAFDGVTPYYVIDSFYKASDNNIYGSGGLYDPVSLSVVPIVVRITPPAQITAVFALSSRAVPSDQEGFDAQSIVEDPAVARKFLAGITGGTYDGIIAAPGEMYRDGVLDDTGIYVVSPVGHIYRPYSAAFNGTVYVCWGSSFLDSILCASDTIRKRASSGSWSNLTMPAAPAGGAHFQGVVRPLVLGSKLWLYGVYNNNAGYHRNHLLSVTTGDVVANAHAIANSDNSLPQVFAAFNGFLYYAWVNTVTGHVFLGRTDGTTFTDAHWDATAAGYFIQNLMPNIGDGTSLYAIGIDVSNDLWVLKSAGSDTTSWSQIVKLPATYQPQTNSIGVAAE